MRLLRRLSYANVAATLALFVALSGTAVAGAKFLITGKDVKNHSLTGADIRNGSLGLKSLSPAARASLKGTRGPAGRQGQKGEQGLAGSQGQKGDLGTPGPQGATGSQGAPGVGVTTATASGIDVIDYQDFTPLVSSSLSSLGDYVIFTTLTVQNTGASNEYLNCGYKFGGTISGAAGVDTTAGGTATGTSVGVVTVGSTGTVDFVCTGSGATTYDISNIKMRVHYLG